MSKEKTVEITATVMRQTAEGLKNNAEENDITESEAAERLISRWKTDDPLVALYYILEHISNSCMNLSNTNDAEEVLSSVFEVLRKSMPKDLMKDTAEQVEALFAERGVQPFITLTEDPTEQNAQGGDGSEQ